MNRIVVDTVAAKGECVSSGLLTKNNSKKKKHPKGNSSYLWDVSLVRREAGEEIV